jgi:alkylation response protein AidB-like acyl-CoA dehydrogenase
LIDWGTDTQKRDLLPGILSAEQMWCLGFSEPNAGSDLASLRTRAERDGDEWVITGQKVWCSRAHLATWCLLLARTDPIAAKHKGLTALIVPMTAPGMDIVPTKQITGESEFCEVFFEGCRIPADHVLGAVNGGWTVIRSALAHERGTLWATEFKIRLRRARARSPACIDRSAPPATTPAVARLATGRARWIESTVFAAQTLRTWPKLHGRQGSSARRRAAEAVRQRDPTTHRGAGARARGSLCATVPRPAPACHRDRLAGSIPLRPLGDDFVRNVRSHAQPPGTARPGVAARLNG